MINYVLYKELDKLIMSQKPYYADGLFLFIEEYDNILNYVACKVEDVAYEGPSYFDQTYSEISFDDAMEQLKLKVIKQNER